MESAILVAIIAAAEPYREALLALAQGNPGPAMETLRATVEREKQEGKKRLQAAAAAARSLGAIAFVESTLAAKAAYEDAVSLDPTDADSWNTLGAIYLQTGDLVKGENAFRHALELNRKKGNAGGEVMLPFLVSQERPSLRYSPRLGRSLARSIRPSVTSRKPAPSTPRATTTAAWRPTSAIGVGALGMPELSSRMRAWISAAKR